MAIRSELQAKSIKDLRSIAETVGIKTDGIQKAKLIDAIMGTGTYAGPDGVIAIDLPDVVAKDVGSNAKTKPPAEKATAKRGDSNGEPRAAAAPAKSGAPAATAPGHQRRGDGQKGGGRQASDQPSGRRKRRGRGGGGRWNSLGVSDPNGWSGDTTRSDRRQTELERHPAGEQRSQLGSGSP